MARALKVYAVNYDGKEQRIVAATSMKQAAALIGVAYGMMRAYGHETGNVGQCADALSEPGVVWREPYNARRGPRERVAPTQSSQTGEVGE